jgi:type IV secretory pathway VirD2 relaxase
MSVIEAENPLEGALNAGRVRRKANNTRDLKGRAARVAKGSPEVMVKITGFGKGAQHVKSHLDYISRNAKVELETERGEILATKEELKELFKDWSADFDDSKRRKNQRDTMHMVLSMPEGTPQEAVRQGARAFAKEVFGRNHEYVFALHTDEPHPHVHITVKMQGKDGTRLNPRKADLQRWREAFAEKMRDEGIEAEATPRAVRGKVKKAERQVIRHIERGQKGREATDTAPRVPARDPRVPRVRAEQVRQAAHELAAEARGEHAPAGPWEKAIKERQSAVRLAWLLAAAELEKQADLTREKPNVRPDYDRINLRAARAGQRAAAVYQSHLDDDRRKAPAAAVAGVRNVSTLGVVHDQRPAQVLLQADAPGGVGRHRDAHSAMRRTGDSLARLTERSRGLIGARASDTAEKSLAGSIRAFVEAMPTTIDTARDELKRRLASQFSRPLDQQADAGRDVGQAPQPGRAPAKGPDR